MPFFLKRATIVNSVLAFPFARIRDMVKDRFSGDMRSAILDRLQCKLFDLGYEDSL